MSAGPERKCRRCAFRYRGPLRTCFRCRAKLNDDFRAYYRELRRAGLCVGCKAPSPEAVRCAVCAPKQSARLRRWRRRQKERA